MCNKTDAANNSSSSYTLYCTVCESYHDCKERWQEHLLQASHQDRARLEMLEWDKEMRDCVLVVYSDLPLVGNSDGVIRCFSEEATTIVTDFVWWPERPRIGFVQFESRKELMAVLSGFQAGQVLVDNQMLQLQQASNLLDLQWKAFLPVEGIQKEPVLTLNPPPEKQDEQPCDPSMDNRSCLKNQLEKVINAANIPEDESTAILNVLKTLNQLGSCQKLPFEAALFRHSHLLNLDSSSSSSEKRNYLIYISSRGKPVSDRSLILKAVQDHDNLGQWTVKSSDQQGGFSMGHKFRNPSKNFSFTLVFDSLAIAEAQLTHLSDYLLTFDPRCSPLLSLVYYWANVNEIKLGIHGDQRRRNDSPQNVSEPAALNWLLISFLCGVAKVIPTPRDILERPHQIIEISEETVFDVGFSLDPEYVREWSAARADKVPKDEEEVCLSVLELAQKFFDFYGRIISNERWVVNTKDGETILMKRLASPGTNNRFLGTRLNDEEITMLRNCENQAGSAVDFSKLKLYITHPFNLMWQLSVRNGQVPKFQRVMSMTGSRLRNFLNQYKKDTLGTCGGGGRGDRVNLMRMLNVKNVLPGWALKCNHVGLN